MARAIVCVSSNYAAAGILTPANQVVAKAWLSVFPLTVEVSRTFAQLQVLTQSVEVTQATPFHEHASIPGLAMAPHWLSSPLENRLPCCPPA